jgi:hypothetical protein
MEAMGWTCRRLAEAGVLAFLLGFSGPARAQDVTVGARAGLRATTLGGQIVEHWAMYPAVAGVALFEISPYFAAGVEPGLVLSGSDRYRLTYASLPLVGHGRYPLGDRWRLRASAGLAPAWLLDAKAKSSYGDDDGGEHEVEEDVGDDVRTLNVSLLGAAAIEWRMDRGHWLFAELRYGRGLITLDRGDPGVFITDREIGLWLGGLLR